MRHANRDWNVCNDDNVSFNGAQLAVLMDIRDEMQKLNRIIGCPNFIDVPQILRAIKKNTTPKRKRKAKVAK